MDVARPNPVIHVVDFPACDPTGCRDSTFAFQSAHDSLPNGGTIIVPPGLYLVSRVNISNKNISYELDPAATLRRFGNGGADNRGMFDIRNLLNAKFILSGGVIDLNGEGCQGIGVNGRINNTYKSKYKSVFPNILCIDGPENSAIYALRCSYISVKNVKLINSGETAILFRNCSDISCADVSCRNIANCGIEFSIVAPAMDGGNGVMLDRGRYLIENCQFDDIDDFGLGTGNGVAILFGGSGGEGAIRDVVVKGCTFRRCQRDIHVEFTVGTWVENFTFQDPHSYDARQGSIGLVGARNGTIAGARILNSGYAPTGALLAQILGTEIENHWPSMNAITISQDVVDVRVCDFQIIDSRNSKIRIGDDGSIRAGSTVFKSVSANFTDGDEGTFIGIAGAGVVSSGIATQLIARIIKRVSATRVILDLVASTTVSRAKFAYGGASREPLRERGARSFEWHDGIVIAGVHSGLPNEPKAAAVLIDSIPSGGHGKISNLTVLAPATLGTTPAGLRVTAVLDGTLDLVPGTNRIEGFFENFVGTGDFIK